MKEKEPAVPLKQTSNGKRGWTEEESETELGTLLGRWSKEKLFCKLGEKDWLLNLWEARLQHIRDQRAAESSEQREASLSQLSSMNGSLPSLLKNGRPGYNRSGTNALLSLLNKGRPGWVNRVFVSVNGWLLKKDNFDCSILVKGYKKFVPVVKKRHNFINIIQ